MVQPFQVTGGAAIPTLPNVEIFVSFEGEHAPVRNADHGSTTPIEDSVIHKPQTRALVKMNKTVYSKLLILASFVGRGGRI